MTLVERAPQYIAEAERLLGTEAFYDTDRESQLIDGSLTFTAETAGMRGILYVRALRLIAQASLERDIDESRSVALRPTRLGRFALEHLPEVIDISRQLAVINIAERTLAEQTESFIGGLRDHQPPYMQDLISFMNAPPSKVSVMGENGPYDVYIRGATVEAPTGIGKTVLMARTLAGLGVGREVENLEYSQDRVRALIIVPSQTLVEQMSGIVGDDTLRRFAPGIDVGAYYQHDKNDTADAVVITIDQFIDSFRNGALNGQTFDICIIDEAHNATQPLFQRALLEHWRGGPIIGFTATPEYHPKKDVRNLLTHRIFHGDFLDYIQGEEDVLNAAQLYEIRVTHDAYIAKELLEKIATMTPAEIEQLVLREATADYLTPQIAEGRRGIVFCQQGRGKPSGNAIDMAERLRELKRPDGSPLRVAVAGSINKGKSPNDPDSNVGIRRRYAAGDLDYIVTVDWGREGLNEDVDSVTAVGKITSELKFLQEIGRGTRLSKRFPVTTYGHLFTPSMGRNALSLFGVFGFEAIEQGVVIGKKTPPSPNNIKDFPEGTDVNLRQNASPQSPDSPPQNPEPPEPDGIPLSAFPERLRALIDSVHTKTVGEALFHSDIYTHVPKEYIKFDDLTRHVPGPPVTIRKYLRDEKGFACIGRYEVDNTGRPFVFYFEPAAQEYINTFRGAVARVTLQREFGGVDVSIVDAFAKECGITPVMWFHEDGKFITHYTRHEAERIRAKFLEVPPALPTDYTRVKLAAAAGISERGIKDRLLPHEIARIVRKRTTTANGKIRVLDHWSQKNGDAIVERIKDMLEAGGVPPYLVPQELAIRYIQAGKDRLIEFADSTGDPSEIVRIARGGRPPRCIRWSVIQQAEERFGRRIATLNIDYARLPTNHKDKDPAKLQYAKDIIAQFESLPPQGGSK